MSFINSFIGSFKSKEPEFHEIPQGDPKRGKLVFQQHCADCHYLQQCNDIDLQAPSLAGLINRKAGSTFNKASNGLKRAGFKWNQEHLFNFLRNPQKYIPGNAMVWPGMKDAKQRADLIAFIKIH